MTDDDLDRLLGAARPPTAADDGWAASTAGDDSLAAIRARTARRTRSGRPSVRTLRRLRPFSLGIGFAAVAATVVAIGVAMPGSTSPRHPVRAGGPSSPSGPPPVIGAVPGQMALAGYDTCAAMRDALRQHTAQHVTAWGLDQGGGGIAYDLREPVAATANQSTAGAGAASTPDHSTTNDQEVGADEPDIVKTDGRRVVSVSGGVLRVVDAGTRKVTGTLDLRAYAGAQSAQLFVAGDRALVILGQQYVLYGDRAFGALPYGGGSSAGSTFLLVDLAAEPTVVSTLHTDGGYVDARLIGGVARVVVASSPKLAFGQYNGDGSDKKAVAANRRVVEQAPLSAWLPTYQTTDGGRTSTHQVPCDRVSHPVHYTGESMVTVYSFDPATSLDDPKPISVAADASTVYATAGNLYVASGDGNRTQLHRFWVGDTGAPRYVGSGSVPGWLLDSYSLSEYDGTLRVVTTNERRQATALYVLDADTLRRRGEVDGLGVGENLHAVRFLGPLAYVVTFESVDPLFVLDLADRDHPVKAGELTVTGYSDYLHPVADGRLLGVGQDVDRRQLVSGLQVSLFDVADPAKPSRLDNVVRRHTPSESPLDPHAFLWWPATHTAVIPIDSWNPGQSGAALVVRVGTDHLTVQGTVRNPAVSTEGYDAGISRTLVIGDDLWTMSSSGLLVSSLQTLDRQGWVAFS